MIPYKSKTHIFQNHNYDKTYSYDHERFSHKVTFQVIDEVLNTYWREQLPQGCIDIGCGQGQILEYVFNKVKEKSQEFIPTDLFFGIDISEVGIEQSNARCPTLNWVVDSYQEFLKNPDIRDKALGAVDLIINKGGLTFVTNEADYWQTIQDTAEFLSPRGGFLFVQNKSFFHHWTKVKCSHWEHDIFDIMTAVLGNPTIIPNTAYYAIYYRRDNSNCEQQLPQKDNLAKRAVFQFTGGSQETILLRNDEIAQERLACLVSLEKPNKPYIYPIPLRYNEKTQKRHQSLIDIAVQNFIPSAPRVLISPSRLYINAKTRSINLTKPLIKALVSKISVSYFPQALKNTRILTRHLYTLLASHPDLMVLGAGLTDFWINLESGQPQIDIDEFEYRLDWIFDVCRNQHDVEIIMLLNLPLGDSVDESKGLRYSEALARSYAETILNLAKHYSVHCFDVTHFYANSKIQLEPDIPSISKEWMNDFVTTLTELIVKLTFQSKIKHS